jgi:Holliday junction resolvase-like predicted endonuclease
MIIIVRKMTNLKIQKSTRHSKITGDFAEHLILYWLSKYGFECAKVDHTGIDLIAKNPKTGELMGISVKSRSRNEGKEGQYVSIPNDNFDKIENACKAFKCKPYFAIVVDEESTIKAFILSVDLLLKYFPMGKTAVGWKMTKPWIDKYNSEKKIFKFEFEHKTGNWW